MIQISTKKHPVDHTFIITISSTSHVKRKELLRDIKHYLNDYGDPELWDDELNFDTIDFRHIKIK